MRPLYVASAVLAVVALVAALPAGAAPAQFALTGGVPLRAAGNIAMQASGGALVLEGAPGELGLQASVVRATALPEVATVDKGGDAITGPFRFVAGPDGFHAIVIGSSLRIATSQPVPAPSAAWDVAKAQVSLLLQPLELGRTSLMDLTIPVGTHEARGRDATIEVFPTRIVLLSGALEATTPDARGLPLGIATPTTGPVVLDLVDARLSGTIASVTLYAPDLLVHVDGLARFAWAQGRIESSDANGWVDDAVLLGGRFELRSIGVVLSGAPAIQWLGAGDVHLVTFGAPVEEAVVPAAAVAGAAGVAALGVVAAAYHWPALRYAGAVLVAPLYARLRRDEVLDHAGRSLVYDRIRADPGVSADRLAASVDFGWSTLAYHLRVLERTDLVVSVREGRHRRFFDREDGRFANGRKLAVAVLKNEHTLAVGRAILDGPGVTQKALSERFHLSPSSVHWHVERLRNVGLLEKKRDGHHVRYFPGPAWSGVEAPLPEAARGPIAAPGAASAIP